VKQSKDLVEAIERGENLQAVSDLLQGLLGSGGPTGDLLEVLNLAQKGNKIEAIKLYRQITGLGLKESKEAVEAMQAGDLVTTTFSSGRGSLAMAGNIEPGAARDVNRDISSRRTIKLDPRLVGPTVAATGAGISCWIIALILVILAATIIPLVMAFSQDGGPLAPLFNKVNPSSFVDIELQFGEEGIGAGQFSDPRTIAADREGNIYAADFDTGRIQSFDPSGAFRWQANLGEDTIIVSLEAEPSGALLAVAGGDVHRFDTTTGRELEPIPNPQDYYFNDLNSSADGRIAAVVGSEDVAVFNSSYEQVLYIPEAVSSISRDSELDCQIDLDGLGNIYVLGSFNNAVFKYTPDGRYSSRFGGDGDEKGQFRAPGDLAIDGQGRVYVSDFKGVQVFDSTGRYLDAFNFGGFEFGVNFDLQNKLYTVSNDPQVMRLSLRK